MNMMVLAICCPEMRRDIMRHNMKVDYSYGNVRNAYGEEMLMCPYCKKEFEWRMM